MSSQRNKTPRPAQLWELRAVLPRLLQSREVRVRRTVDGALTLWAVAEAFAGVADPAAWLSAQLEGEGLSLPERTLTYLYGPDELDEEERRALFVAPVQTTPTWGDTLLREPGDGPLPDDRGFGCKVVAFWGLKGGVGRSTALAYVASHLGRRKKVLAIDLDLDSPGLLAALTDETTLGQERIPFDNLLKRAADAQEGDETLKRDIALALRSGRDVDVRLSILGPGGADTDFILSLLGPLAPAALYRGNMSAVRRFVRLGIEAAGAQIVLLDARSGYCDESAMAVLDLADEVVLFSSPAPSTFVSLAPAIHALERNRVALGRPRTIHLVAGMVPAGNDARKRIMEALRTTAEQALGEVSTALHLSEMEVRGDVEVIAIDYMPAVVENEGQVAAVQPSAYRELAARLLPEERVTLPDEVAPDWIDNVIAQARVPGGQAEDEDDSEQLAQLFTSTRQLEEFVRHEVCLVLGAKGTGKTYLHRICLLHRELLQKRSAIAAVETTRFVDGYSKRLIALRSGPPITPDLLRALESAAPWSDVWSALALGRALWELEQTRVDLSSLSERGGKDPLMALQQAQTVRQMERAVLKAIRNPLALEEGWDRLDRLCQRSGITLTLLFDDLDVALSERPSTRTEEKRRAEMIGGLLDRVATSWLPRRHVAAKVFLREDLFRVLRLQDEAKFASRRVVLRWDPSEIWRLVVRAMAVAAPQLASYLGTLGIRVETLEQHTESDIDRALAVIWGERMGEGEGQTYTKAWVWRRLHDGAQRMFPRAALWLLRFALEAQLQSGSDGRLPLLRPPALRTAIAHVASERFKELQIECTPVERKRLDLLRGLDAYQDQSVFLRALKKAGADNPQTTLDMYRELGITESGSRRDGTPTVRVVDLYAFAPELEITRIGRR